MQSGNNPRNSAQNFYNPDEFDQYYEGTAHVERPESTGKYISF